MDLPALRVTIDNHPSSLDDWQASMDGENWNIVETSSVFGSLKNTPLGDPEWRIDLTPKRVLAIRNATANDSVIRIAKNGYVLVDFFHLEVGTVQFKVNGMGELTAFVGESPEDALNEDQKYFEQYPIEPIDRRHSSVVTAKKTKFGRLRWRHCLPACMVFI